MEKRKIVVECSQSQLVKIVLVGNWDKLSICGEEANGFCICSLYLLTAEFSYGLVLVCIYTINS